MLGRILRRRSAVGRPGDAGTASRARRRLAIAAAGAVALLPALAAAVPANSWSLAGPVPAALVTRAAATGNTGQTVQAPAEPATAPQISVSEPSAASPVLASRMGLEPQIVARVASHAELEPQAAPEAGLRQAGATPAAAETAAMPEPSATTVRYGPIPVLPTVLGHPSTTTAGVPLLGNLPLLPMPCSNCLVTGTTIDLVYDNGQPANLDSGVMLHHLVLFQPQVDDATCARTTPVGLLGQRLFASGNERTPGNLPAGYGVHLGTGPLAAYFDIMNHSDQLKLVYVTATVRWLPDSTPGIKAVTPVWFDENNCSTSVYPIPAGPTSRTWRWTSTMTGRFVAAGGHVHDGGVRTMLMNETTGKHICSSVAGYGTKPAYMGSIESMSVCSWDRLGTVRQGEVLALETDYVSSEPQSDVMGIMIAYLYPTDDLTGGTPAPMSMTDPPTTVPPAVMHHHG